MNTYNAWLYGSESEMTMQNTSLTDVATAINATHDDINYV